MELVYLMILLALVEYTVFTALVGRARARYGIKAPAMTGHPDFERVNRVHYNTLEALIVFIPALLLFAHYIDPRWAAGLGALFVIARVLYAVGYIRAAEKRGPGAVISGVVNLALMAGALFGVIRALL
jgi:glutathione S-transferase